MALKTAWVKGLTEDQVRKAERELGETPRVKAEALEELRELIREEDGFYPLMDEAFLVRFLRCKKYDVKRAFKTMKNYYWYRATYSGIATDLTPVELKHLLEMNAIFISPKRSPVDGGILLAIAANIDTDMSSIEHYLATAIICAEVGMETDASQVCGSSLLFDMKGITWKKLKHFSSPSFLAMIVRGIQDCWPYRLNSIHFVHEPIYFSFTWSILRPMLSKKIKDRVQFHGSDYSSLYPFLPKETLPESLGGQLGEKDFKDFRNMILQNNALIERMNKYIYQGIKSAAKEKSSSSKEDPNETTSSLFNVTMN